MQGQNQLWATLYERRFNASHPATRRQQRAAELAGSWKQLFQCKTLLCREVSYPRIRRILILSPAVRCQTAGRICMTAFNDPHARVCMRIGIVLPCSTTPWHTHGRPGTARFAPMLTAA